MNRSPQTPANSSTFSLTNSTTMATRVLANTSNTQRRTRLARFTTPDTSHTAIGLETGTTFGICRPMPHDDTGGIGGED